ncbi:gephyrin-like molybdotransferase Glp [uncultured Thiothrix sp.]|uniref:molybdopterin molybdotransferase MoeA n=1 Tax=uncultured Thiothrix sp. TaxID=223185 RepID=UPI00261F40E7|nr:gephyrin-like molybdotransferase Glp [uncultured Thiothrix sp.]HMT92861.1 molybdopterin molybdotransferase MoeA [Thiolinea sp.]
MSASSTCDALPEDVLTVEQAQDLILNGITAITATELVDLKQANGRILAEDIQAGFDVPPYCNSSMDGYAFAYQSLLTHAKLTQIGISWAGRPYLGTVQLGECVRIMTGACLPAGTDTVEMQENTEKLDEHIIMHGSPKLGENVRYPGDDLKQGEIILTIGRKLTAADIGMLASLGMVQVKVLRKLRIAFLSTGDELKSTGAPLAWGEIYDSNRYTLHALLQHLPVDILDLGIIPDQAEAVEQAFLQAKTKADLLITSGGVSVGDADFVTKTLSKLGQVKFWKMAMKPGKPLAYGRLDDCLFFGLPGNPVSVIVTFLLFVRPAILKLAGNTVTQAITHTATTLTPLKKTPGRKDFQRGIYQRTTEGYQVKTTGEQASHVLRSMSQANCFIVLEREWGDIEVGSQVKILPFDSLV